MGVVRFVIAFGLFDQVDAIEGIPARPRDRSGLSRRGVVSQHERLGDGDATGVVDRGRVCVAEMAGVEIGGRERMGGGLIGTDGEGAAVDIDVGDRGERAVADPEASLIPQGHDPVTGLVGATVELECRSGQATRGLDACAGPGVEIVDVVATSCDHEDLFVT